MAETQKTLRNGWIDLLAKDGFRPRLKDSVRPMPLAR
jgi:hypothetical protein